MPKLKREHRAINEPRTVAGNNLLPCGLPFRFRSAKRRAVVLRCSPFAQPAEDLREQLCGERSAAEHRTPARPQLIVPSR
jgi:hypothetical protein